MKIHKSSIALAIASLCLAGTAQAADNGAQTDDLRQLGVTMRALGEHADVSEVMNRIELPEQARVEEALSKRDNHSADNSDHGHDPDNHPDNDDVHGNDDEHGSAVSAIATTLGDNKRDSDEAFRETHDQLLETAKANAGDDAAEEAEEAAEHAAEEAAEEAERTAEEAAEEAERTAEEAAEEAERAAEEAAEEAERAADMAAEEAERAADKAAEAATRAAEHTS